MDVLKDFYKYVRGIVDNLRKIVPGVSEDAHVELHIPSDGTVKLCRIVVFSVGEPFMEYIIKSKGIICHNQETSELSYLIESENWPDLINKLKERVK
jgi:hypothetical protein